MQSAVHQRPLTKRKLRTESVALFDREHDCFVLKRVAKSATEIPLGFDLDDIVRTPILQILRTQEQDRDPRTGLYCILGRREQCTLYDDLVKESRRFTSKVPKKADQARYLNAPERVLLSAYPPFCEACTWVEHARRRRESSRLRRFIRWLRPSS